MSDRSLDDGKPRVDAATSAFLDQLQQPFSAGNISDSSAVAGYKKSSDHANGKASINDLLFDPKIFQGTPSRLELPAIVPIPRDMPPEILAKRAEALKQAPLNKEQKLALKELTDLKFGTIVGSGLQETKALTEQLVKEKSKVAVWPQYKEGFQKAVNASDQNYFQAEKTQAPVIAAAELNYGMANSRFVDAYKTMDDEIKHLPPDAQTKAAQLKTDLQDPAKTAAARQSFNDTFKAYPDFVNATGKLIEKGDAFNLADGELTAARKPLLDAAREEALTRFVYKRAADLAGDSAASKSMGVEALMMANRAVEIAQKPKPAAAKLTPA
ncbi:hypothetical protein BH11CYA1_BH11CYA1_23770 [soil metagenome]